MVDRLFNAEVTITEPPRRVFYNLNKQIPVQFCDYLFPSETVKTVQQQTKDFLDLDLKPEQIQIGVEQVAEAPQKQEDKNSGKKDSSKVYILGVVVALLILLLSILVHYLMNN